MDKGVSARKVAVSFMLTQRIVPLEFINIINGNKKTNFKFIHFGLFFTIRKNLI